MDKPVILSFSGKARSGKDSSVAFAIEYLTEKGCRCLRQSYADYVKYISEKVYGWNGLKDEAGRTLLQNVAEMFRAKDENFWVDQVIRLVSFLPEPLDYILISDCRYDNEPHRWAEAGYKVITVRLHREGVASVLTPEQQNHISETQMDHYEFDFSITAKDLVELKSKTIALMDVIHHA